jgi:hypothetical protein
MIVFLGGAQSIPPLMGNKVLVKEYNRYFSRLIFVIKLDGSCTTLEVLNSMEEGSSILAMYCRRPWAVLSAVLRDKGCSIRCKSDLSLDRVGGRISEGREKVRSGTYLIER